MQDSPRLLPNVNDATLSNYPDDGIHCDNADMGYTAMHTSAGLQETLSADALSLTYGSVASQSVLDDSGTSVCNCLPLSQVQVSYKMLKKHANVYVDCSHLDCSAFHCMRTRRTCCGWCCTLLSWLRHAAEGGDYCKLHSIRNSNRGAHVCVCLYRDRCRLFR